MVNASYFRKVNSNYIRPHINELARPRLLNGWFIIDTKLNDVKSNNHNINILSENNLIICHGTNLMGT